MARYTDDSRERVRDAVDFAELVGARTELKRAGVARLQGLCPFHEERSPSFGINPVEKVYYCFGCGAGGDVFKFVMETEGLDFGAALESLAERYRVVLERESEDPRDAERRQRRERLYALLERTAAYYVRVLWEAADAAPAREYLASRGLEEGALRAFRVGFAPDTWDRVALGSRKAGYSEHELLAAGLVQRSQRGTVIDRFRGRVTFPLADERGRVLGFGARAMKPDDKPKYLNTSENDLFHKGRIVYGADMARAAAARAGRVVLVEGYTDVIALHQAGVPESVAQMGTALTDAQVDAIARLAPKALFCQDPDRAGQESVAKGIAALRTHNKGRATKPVEFRIVRLPTGEDPADVVQRSGAEAMRALLEEAVPIERFEVERALEQPGASTDEMLAAVASDHRLDAGERAARRARRARRRPPRAGREPGQRGAARAVTSARRAAGPCAAAACRGAAATLRGGGSVAWRWRRQCDAPAIPRRAPAGERVARADAAPRRAAARRQLAGRERRVNRSRFRSSFRAGPTDDPPAGRCRRRRNGTASPARTSDPGAAGPPPNGAKRRRRRPLRLSGAVTAARGVGARPPATRWRQGRFPRARRPAGRPARRRTRPRPLPAARPAARARRSARGARPARASTSARSWRSASRCPTRASSGSAAVDLDDYFSAPATRQAAALSARPPARPDRHLPAGDEALARLVAELVVDLRHARGDPRQARARGAPAGPAPPRAPHLRAPASPARSGVRELAVERQRVLDEIRHRLRSSVRHTN